jgi:NAD(P)H-dependent FMN reductase
MTTPLDIVGLCGSLRHASINRAALRLAGEVMPAGMTLDIAEIRDIPFFDGDVMAQGWPAAVAALRERIRKADAVVIATPEYNFSTPGVLKNTLDWLSRGEDQPFAFKPVAILSASPGPLGGARVQYDLRRVMLQEIEALGAGARWCCPRPSSAHRPSASPTCWAPARRRVRPRRDARADRDRARGPRGRRGAVGADCAVASAAAPPPWAWARPSRSSRACRSSRSRPPTPAAR